MTRRGLINERDEAHAMPHMARLHCISSKDSLLCDFGNYLAVGALQLAVAMLEYGWLDAPVLLEDPVEACAKISHSLGASSVGTLYGNSTTALDLQQRFHESAVAFVEAGLAEGIVPDAEKILERWGETLDMLRLNDLERLSRRLDWAAKLRLIGRAVEEGRLEWGSPQARILDLAYSNLDPDEGLFFLLERSGIIERLTESSQVSACLSQPEPDTRAYARGRLLDLAPDRIVGVDWDFIKFLVRDPYMKRMSVRTFDMSDPLFWNERNTQHVFDRATGIEDVLNKLDALRPEPVTQAIEVTHDKSTAYAYEQYQ
jgi:proteasome accessory factor A